MKSKLSVKVLGIVVTIATLASLLVGLTAAPVSAANTAVFTPYTLPDNRGNTIGGVTYNPGGVFNATAAVISNPVINAVTASADGNTIFAWDDTNKALYMSTNGGKAFTSVGINTTGTFVGLEVSPKFATDGTVVLVTSTQVWLVSGGLATAVSVTGDLSAKLEGGTITAMDVGNYYTNGVLSVFIGVSGGAGLISNVLVFQTGGFTWAEVGVAGTAASSAGFLRTPDFATDPQVIAVKLSPNYSSDAEVMAVYTFGGSTYLSSNIAALGWNNSILPACTVAAPANGSSGVATSAIINAGTDYFANSSGTVLVGIGAGLTQGPVGGPYVADNGLFIVKGRVAAGGTATAILGGNATNGNVPVNGIAVQGPIATSSVVVSSPTTTALNITTGVTASAVTWGGSAAYRGATGTAITSMWYAGTNNVSLLAASSGTNGAINLSADNGNTFNQIGLVNVASFAMAGSPSIVSDTNWYSKAANGLWQSKDKGASWVRIFGNSWGTGAYYAGMSRSQNFATNNTFIINNGTNIALITTNGGSTYSAIGAPIAIGSLSMIENDAYYIVSKSTDPVAFYVSTRPYVNATFTPAMTGFINSLTRSGKDATHMTFAVGSTDGKIYQSTDGGVTFTPVGTWPGAATDKISVSYSSDGTLWAFANGTTLAAPATQSAGIYQWVSATSSWLNCNVTVPVTGWTIAADGTAYATADFLFGAAPAYTGSILGMGVLRSLNYNAINPDGSSGATWGPSINGTSFPGGSATATIGTAAVGYPGGVPAGAGVGFGYLAANAAASQTTGVSVLASAATGNTLLITEKTSTVSGSGIFGVLYSFVDAYTTGPVVVSPKDKTVLATDTSATMSWTAMSGPAGGSSASATNYEAQITASTDFSGGTTPVFKTATSTMDVYNAGNTSASMGVNPGASPTALKSGTNYSWRVRANTPLQSRWSTQTFTTALSTIVNTPVNSTPANGATGVDVNTTFTWPAVAGANVTYEFVIAEETGQTDKFAIIDYSATTPTNATPLRETLKYNTQYWWRVRATNGTVTSAWSTFFFTTMAAPVTTTTNTQPVVTIPPATSTIITITQPVTSITLTQGSTNNNSIPPALLWAVIAIGAILIIAVIVLIVRTRRIP